MHRKSTTVAVLALALSSMGLPGHIAAQSVVIPLVPATAAIRGENIHLRLDPAEVTEVVAILQRGDPITITGDLVAADGDEFYPIQIATGESGWVRDLFIDPRSIVPLDAPADVEVEVEPEPAPVQEIEIDVPEEPTRRERRAQEDAAETEEAAESGEDTQNQRNRRNRDGPNAADEEPLAEAEAGGEAVASVSGVGATTSETFQLEPGRYTVTASMQVDDATGFIADLLGQDDFQETLFNETIEDPQEWTAETVVRIRDAGEYYVAVSDTELEWTIEFAPA